MPDSFSYKTHSVPPLPRKTQGLYLLLAGFIIGAAVWHLRLPTTLHSLLKRKTHIKGYQAAKSRPNCTVLHSLDLLHDQSIGLCVPNPFHLASWFWHWLFPGQCLWATLPPCLCSIAGLLSSALGPPFGTCLLRKFPTSQLLLCKYLLLQAPFPCIYHDSPGPQLNWKMG